MVNETGVGHGMPSSSLCPADPAVKIDNPEAFTFNFGNMKHFTEVHGDELWIYVQKNARTVTINREEYAPIKKWGLEDDPQRRSDVCHENYF